MYESFFGFVKRPFLAVSTLDRYFPGSSIEQTFQTTSRAIQRGEGPVAIFGGTGLGKTMCCLRVAENFRRNFEVVMLASSQLITRRALLQSLLFELRMPYREMSEGELRLTLMNRLQPSTENPSDGLVLIVDEAQTLSIKLLEELRLLTNVVRNGVPRVRLILCGTMRLEESLGNPMMESLNQRLAARCYLTPLSLQETGQYVKHKIELSGVESSSVMTRDALDAIFRGSDGVPRLIDQLADQALMLACADRERPVSAAMVGRAWCMLQQLPNPWSEPESIVKQEVVNPVTSIRPPVAENATLAAFLTTPPQSSSPPAPPSIATASDMPMWSVVPTRVNESSAPSSSIEFGLLDDDLVGQVRPASDSLLRSFTNPGATIDAGTNRTASSGPAASSDPVASRSSASPVSQPTNKKNVLDVFAGDFDEEFSIPVQTSGGYQAYSGAAYGNLNYDLSNFGSQANDSARNVKSDIQEANDFLSFATPPERSVARQSASLSELNPAQFKFAEPNTVEPHMGESNMVAPNTVAPNTVAHSYFEPVSNISPEQAANLERQIEEEMRELVSGLNLNAMTFDPAIPIDAFPVQSAFTFEAVHERDSVDAQRTHQAHSDVLSFSGLNSSPDRSENAGMYSDMEEQRAAMNDDRDLLVIEDELETVRSGAQQAAVASSRAVLHPYAKLFTKLRNS
ncbi:MAG: AAA family ATPase [Pirellula sp.]